MLTRVYGLLHAENPALLQRTRLVLKPPEVCRYGSKRVAWVNFKSTCELCVKLLRRPRGHARAFLPRPSPPLSPPVCARAG